jgi:TonB family protein
MAAAGDSESSNIKIRFHPGHRSPYTNPARHFMVGRYLSALLSLAALLSIASSSSFALTSPAVAQERDGSAPAQASGGDATHGVYKVGGDVSAPVLIRSVEPEYPEKARQTGASGTVLVNLYVDVHGIPSHVRVVRGLGMELDESASKAVRQYRFRPAMKDGKPVMVEFNVEVSFQQP